MTSTSTYRHAIVIGSSIAGLTAARVLSDHFERVTVIERDQLPEDAEYRKGVPQARHAHQLMLRGRQALESLFPGLSQELLDKGAVSVNIGQHLYWHVFGRERVNYESALNMLSMSRPLLESTIYRRIRELPNVSVVQRTGVIGLETDASGTAVSGVRIRPLTGDHRLGDTTTLHADLVVDCSGRESRAPEWLKDLGFPAPERIEISSEPSYASRVYRRPAGFPEEIKAIYIQQTPPDLQRGGIILPMEDDLWQVSLVGMRGDYVPTDEAGFLEFARSLPNGALYEAISQAQPVSPIYGFRHGETCERRYQDLERYLEGFVALGDAAYTFNPVYGQGMTVAALSCLTLDACLREQASTGLAGLAKRFQARQAESSAGAWQLASGEDRRWAPAEEQAQLDPAAQLAQRYVEQVIKTSVVNPAVAEVFFSVMQMIEPPTTFFRPDVVLQVFATLPEA
ncbi:MAG TPA: FAD-dependent monooxygenase [Roseiflexaceae bacterium]|nr:FAD-dependent monooxygenase [Roseiflexaceae bacterium]